MKTKQEVFDTAYRGLASQGFKQSKTIGDGCAYRGEGGLKCAVGHLIEDDKYNVELEGLAANSGDVVDAIGEPYASEYLLVDMQEAHDGRDMHMVVTPDEMKSRLAMVAERHGLTVPQAQA